MPQLYYQKFKSIFYYNSSKKSLLIIPFLICFFLSLISQVASAQTTTIDFNDLSAGLFLTKSYDKNGFNFSINAGGGGQIVTRSGEGYQASISLYDNNLEIGALTQWTIKKIDGAEFQFLSIYLKEPSIGASTSGEIQGFKNGNPVGSSKTVDFNGLKSFASDPDFYDIDEIRISAEDINFHLDHFTFGPVYSPVDTTPATISSISISGSPGPFATSISYSVNFNKSVTGVSTDDFQLTTTSTVTGDINAVSGSGSSYTVTVNNILGIGTIRLDLKGGTNIANTNGNIGTPAYTSGPVHTASVMPPNNAPTVANPILDQQANQDELWSYQFAGNTFIDEDDDELTYTTSVLPAWLDFDAGTRTFSGTPGSGDVGTLQITVTANDGNGETVSDTFSLQVNGINAAPSITAPTSLTTNEDTALSLSGISFHDPDAGTNSVAVEMSASNATLSATSGGGVSATYNATTLLLSGSIADINAFIASGGVTFTPNANVFGDLLLEIHINDNGHSGSGGALTANKDVIIEVTAVNDSPVIISPSTIYFLEDEMSPIIGISFSDVDAGSESVAVFFNIATGTFTANSGGGVTVVGSGGTSLTLNGSIEDINAFIAAENLQYTPALNSTTTTLLSVSINDNGHSGSGGATSRQALVFFQISGVNDAPVNHVPGAQNIEIDEVLEFSASNGNSISISDVDAGNNSLQVTLTVTNGTISYTLHPSASLSNGTGLDDTYVEIFGSISQINETLEGMIFTPNPGFIGLAQIEIVTNDRGYVGAGNAGTDTDIIPIQVGPIQPMVTSVSAQSPNGTYKIGDTVTLEVAFSQDVTVTGTPSITLETGSLDAIATYISGSGSSVLTFEFTVEEGHISYLLDYTGTNALVLNDGSITNSTDLDAALTLPNPGGIGSLSANSSLIVDGIRPIATIINVDRTIIAAGQTAGVMVTFSEVVEQLDATDFTVGNGTISDPETLDGITWTFVLTPSSGVSSVSNIVLDNTGFMDAAGNMGVGTTPSNNYKVDTVLPTSSIEVKEETLIIGQTSQVIITFNEPIFGLEIGDLAVENGFLSDLESTDGGTVWTATLTPTPDVESASNVISLNNSLVSDLSGNVGASTTTSNNYLVDTKAPTVIVRNRNFILDASGHISISDSSLDNGSTDGMGIASITPSQYNFNCSSVGLNTVTLTVTDVNGNSASATATVTVEDGAAPTVVTKNITIQLDATGNASITAADIDNGSTDACGIASMTLSQYDFDCSHIGDNTVILTITDVNGNTDSATAIVTVEDITAPVAVTRNITIQLDATGNASITVVDIDNGSTDTCGFASMMLDKYSFDCGDVGANTVTLTVTDVNGNTESATAIVTVEDITAPVVVTKNITIQLDATGNASITAADINNGSTDSCGIASMMLDKSRFDCGDVGANTVTLTVTDSHGNSDSATAIVTVEALAAPIVLTKNIIIQLDATGNASITAADVDNGSSNPCGNVSLSLSKSTFNRGDLGMNEVTLIVTDNEGNEDSASASVLVVAFDDISFPYDGTQRSLVLEGQLPQDAIVEYENSSRTEAGTQIGAVSITISDFQSVTFNASLTIDKINITGISLPDVSATYNGLSHSVVINGNLPAGANVVYSNNGRTDVGTQEVTATISGSNYNQLVLTANLTVTKASQTITWNQQLNFSGCDDVSEIVLTATASSGLPVVYSVDNISIADVIGNVLHIKQPGKVKVTVSQGGNNNYHPAENLEREVFIGAPGLIKQHWDDVLFFDNSSGNIVSYQWYKDGAPILGATKQYYAAGTALNGTYYVEGTTETGDIIISCPLEIVTSSFSRKMTLFPNPVSSEEMFTVRLDFDSAELNGASITMFDISGRLLNTTQVNNSEVALYAPNQKGVYIIYLNLPNGDTKSLNLLVK